MFCALCLRQAARTTLGATFKFRTFLVAPWDTYIRPKAAVKVRKSNLLLDGLQGSLPVVVNLLGLD